MQEIFFPSNANEAKTLSALYRKKKVVRLYKGIYSSNLQTPIEKIILDNWMTIVPRIVPHGILSFSTAYVLKPIVCDPIIPQHIVFLTSTYTKTITLPGLIISISKGDTTSFCEQILPGLARSNIPRMLLENLTVVRSSKYKGVKTIGRDGVETFLAKEMRMRQEAGLNQLRDKAKEVANHLGYTAEYGKLNAIISALYSSNHHGYTFETSYAKAIAKKEPYDLARAKLFKDLYIYLTQCNFLPRRYAFTTASFKNIAFFEAYFSNFIEGTEFIINEAEDIVFSGMEINNRHADSHDVLANFRLTSDLSEISKTPQNIHELLELLQARHAYIMNERPEKQPGKFKTLPNKAGNTYFVAPEDLVGTLTLGFEFYALLQPGMPRALFMHFLISEIHPFADGNGRLARLMLNAELVDADLFKIMIPTVHRDNYLNGLRLASRDHVFSTYCKVMDQAQAYTANINWTDYGVAREAIEADKASLPPDEGLPIFNRALRKLPMSFIV